MPEESELLDTFEPFTSDFLNLEAEVPSSSTHSGSRHKTQKDLEKEEILRKLQGLVSGDRLYFKKSTLGLQVSNLETPISNDFVESKFVCWIYDKMRIYLIVNIDPYGRLRFSYGDLYQMAVAHDLFFHKIDSRFVKILKSEHSVANKKAEQSKYRQESNEYDKYSAARAYTKKAVQPKPKVVNYEFKNRPIPPGVELFCKCKFSNKIEFVKIVRNVIKSNKDKFMEKTINMKELRLIMSQNVRAYELEMVCYLMDENPWTYSTNPWDEPSEDQIKEIIEKYKNAVKNPIYIDLYQKWLSKYKLQVSQSGTFFTQ